MRRATPRPTSWTAAAELADRSAPAKPASPTTRTCCCPGCARALPALWQAAKAGPGQAQHRPADRHDCLPRRRLLRAGQRPLAADCRAITERYQDLDELHDLGEIDLHISGCINSCGHHHSGHIGILGVDKDGKEWYQVTLGGSDGSVLSARPCRARWSAPRSGAEVPDVIEAVLDTYRSTAQDGETFIDTLQRVGFDPSRTPPTPPV
jgi:sulfite reductase (NADPH) hemoprotein beta-component